MVRLISELRTIENGRRHGEIFRIVKGRTTGNLSVFVVFSSEGVSFLVDVHSLDITQTALLVLVGWLQLNANLTTCVCCL